MEPASIDPALPVFPLDGDPLNDPLNDLDLFDDSLGFNMGPIDKVQLYTIAYHIIFNFRNIQNHHPFLAMVNYQQVSATFQTLMQTNSTQRNSFP